MLTCISISRALSKKQRTSAIRWRPSGRRDLGGPRRPAGSVAGRPRQEKRKRRPGGGFINKLLFVTAQAVRLALQKKRTGASPRNRRAARPPRSKPPAIERPPRPDTKSVPAIATEYWIG